MFTCSYCGSHRRLRHVIGEIGGGEIVCSRCDQRDRAAERSLARAQREAQERLVRTVMAGEYEEAIRAEEIMKELGE